MFTLIDSPPLSIIFDPVLSENRLPSVAFNITARWLMPHRQAQIILKECWFEYSKLNDFENDLKRLSNRQIDAVRLDDMSVLPVMKFERIEGKIKCEIIAVAYANMGEASIKVDLYEQEIIEVLANIKRWEKWW